MNINFMLIKNICIYKFNSKVKLYLKKNLKVN